MYFTVASTSGSRTRAIPSSEEPASAPIKTHRGPIPEGSRVIVNAGRTIVLPPRVEVSPPRPGSTRWIAEDTSYRTCSAKESVKLALRQGQVQEALRSADAAVAISHSYDSDALFLRGQVREQAGDEMGALKDYSASLIVEPTLRSAREARAKLLSDLASRDLAILAEA